MNWDIVDLKIQDTNLTDTKFRGYERFGGKINGYGMSDI